jgi:hypothetical protein
MLSWLGASGWHVIATTAAIPVVVALVAWYRKGDAEGAAQMFAVTSWLLGISIVAAALYVAHLLRAPLKLKLAEYYGAAEASRNQAVQFQKQRDEFKDALEAYQIFDMRLDDARAEYVVVHDYTAVGAEPRVAGGLWQAMVTVSHTGRRTVDTTVTMVDIAPLRREADSSFSKHVAAYLPRELSPKNSLETKFELHTRSPKTVIVAYHIASPNDNLPSESAISLVDVSNRFVIPGHDYVIVLVANGRHGQTTYAAFMLGVKVDRSASFPAPKVKLFFKQLSIPIADVLGADHPLAQEYDRRISLPPHAAS